MANTPDDPRKPDPDEQNQPLDSDSAIDFSALNEEEMSGISVIEWASLVEDPSKTGPDSKKSQPEPEPISSQADKPDPNEDVDFGDLVAKAGSGAGSGRAADSSDSSIDLGSSSVIDLEEEDAVEPAIHSAADDSENTDIGDDPVILGSSADLSLDEDEAIDLGPELFSDSGPHSATGRSAIDFEGAAEANTGRGGSSINFDDDVLLESVGSKASGSKRDPIAEGLESGVDLPRSEFSNFNEEDEDDFLSQVKSGDEESSSVDLGSMHSLPMFEMGESENAAKRAKADSSDDVDDAIDLPGMDDVPLKPAKVTSSARPESEESIDLGTVPPEMKGEERPKSSKKQKKTAPAPADDGVAKPRSRAGAFVGGGTLGLVAGAAAMFGAVFMGVVPGLGDGKSTVTQPIGLVVPPPAVQADFNPVVLLIKAGNVNEVKPEDLALAQESNPEHLVARAEYHWLTYLKRERGANPNAALRADADEVQKAIADLNQAIAAETSPEAAAEAYFLRGQIHEATGNANAAKADYSTGLAKFPTHKERFETAIEVLDLSNKISRAEPARMLPWLMMAIALQPPMPEGDNPPLAPTQKPLPPEAGRAFLKALAEARAGNFAMASKLIQEARDRHDQRRYRMLRKQQNPISDPNERLFLLACDVMGQHWLMLEELKGTPYHNPDPKAPRPKLSEILARANEAGKAEVLKEVASKLVKNKPIASVNDLVKVVGDELKAKDDSLASMRILSENQKKEIGQLAEDVKAVKLDLETTQKLQKSTEDALKQSKALAELAVSTLKDVGKAFGVSVADLKTSKEPLLQKVSEINNLAKNVDPRGTIRKLESELATKNSQLAQRWEPTQMLHYWLPLLDTKREQMKLAAAARKDAERVLSDPQAKDQDKARATLIEGLVLRNEQKYAEARTTLKKVSTQLENPDDVSRCMAALKEATNPAAMVAERAATLASQGDRDAALKLLASNLKTLPEPKGPLYLQRARLALEAARAKGSLSAKDPLVVEAQSDAQAANSAEGAYFLGRLAEELGNLKDAVGHYRTAVKLHNHDDEEGAKYFLSLVRAIERARSRTPVLPRGLQSSLGTPSVILALLTVTIQNPEPWDELTKEDQERRSRLSKNPGKVGFRNEARDLENRNLYSKALRTYLDGLIKEGKCSGEDLLELRRIVEGSSNSCLLDSKLDPDPILAERHYGDGLNFFFAKKYPEAEREFRSAIENDKNDARYFYFLGLARLALNKPAEECFDRGAQLERIERPSRAAVSAALERIQGKMRRILNDVRTRPIVEGAN